MRDILAAEVMKWLFNIACLAFVIWALSGCAVTDYQKLSNVLSEAKSGFTYIDQGLDFPPLSVDCNKYEGNCNDLAVCIMKGMNANGFDGAKLEVCRLDGVPHMVVAYKDYVIDASGVNERSAEICR